MSTSAIHAQCDREIAIDDYNDNYVPNDFDNTELAWTGNTSNCTPGTIASSVQTKMIDRINYFRRMCSLNDDVEFSTTLNSHCQEGAVMQEANNSLSHCTGTNNAPCNNWVCNTSNAITASQSSNLAWANWDVFDPVQLYIEDAGAGNTAVGHRRWILYSKATTFGNGLTDNRNVMWVFGNGGNPTMNMKDFIAYPPEGHIVGSLVYPRWSFGIPGADFTSANVSMVDQNNNPISLTVIFNASVGYGDYTIVWEPNGVNTSSALDLEYTVTISNISGAPQSTYEYTTTIIQTTHPPPCPSGEVYSNSMCKCVPNTCPSLVDPAPPVQIVESICQNNCSLGGGSINAPSTDCPSGSTIEYSIDFGNTWSNTLPLYDQGNSITIQSRCLCDINMSIYSPSSEVITNPGTCDIPSEPTGVSITDSECENGVEAGGSFNGFGGACVTGLLTFYTDALGTMGATTTAPSYNQAGPSQTLYMRCVDQNTDCESEVVTVGPTIPDICSCPSLSAAAPEVEVVESICITGCILGGGEILIPIGSCPLESTLEYSIDGGSVWTTVLPIYNQSNSISILTRCNCDDIPSVSSPTSEVITNPGTCDIPSEPTGVSITDSECENGVEAGGSFNGFGGACVTGLLTFYTDALGTMGATTTAPSYNQAGPAQTLYMRCVDQSTDCESEVVTVGPTIPDICPACIDSLFIGGANPVVGIYEADSIIVSEGTVMNGDTARFSANDEIELSNGFESELGAALIIDLNGCIQSRPQDSTNGTIIKETLLNIFKTAF